MASSSGGSASPSDVALQDDAFLAGPKLKLNTFDGVRLWLEGVAYLGRHPLLFLRCVPFAAATLASCLWVSACIWVCALPLRLVGVRVGLDGLLSGAYGGRALGPAAIRHGAVAPRPHKGVHRAGNARISE